MRKSYGSFCVASWNSSIIIKVQGYATLNNSIFFKEFVDSMVKKNFLKFIIDLSECKGMDSTFMGVLASIANDKCGENKSSSVTLINTTEYHRNLLDNLGLFTVLHIVHQEISLPNVEMKCLDEKQYDEKLRIEMIQDAHEHLMLLNDKNKQQFGEFLTLLAEELQENSN